MSVPSTSGYAGPVDAHLLRRATLTIAGQVAAAVAATVIVVSALAYTLTIRAEHRAEERTVRAVTLGAGPVLVGSDQVDLIRRQPDGTVQTGPDTPPALLRLDLTALPAGASNTSEGHAELYVVDGADGSRTVGILDVTAREEAGERLVRSMLLAGGIGIAAAAMLGAILGRAAARPLAQALSLQRRFVADASHELRTPLAVLHTRAQLIQRRLARHEPVNERLRTDVAQLTADTQVLSEVVNDLLLSAELPHRPAHTTIVDLRQLIRSTAASLEPYAAERAVTLEVDTGSAPVHTTGAPTALRRALAALVDNAIAHSSAGGTVTIRTHLADGRAILSVADRGDGLDPAQAAALTRRFARSTSGEQAGRRYGLGLALVREVVDAHGGQLHLDGAPGVGATFTITLPPAEPGANAPEPP